MTRMTPLRHRMMQDLQLRGYSDRTVEAYVQAVPQLAQFYHASPDQLTEEHIPEYLLHLSTVQHVARGTHTIALCGIKFFYQHTLAWPWTVLDVARPKSETKLPVVLSRDEVWRILAGVRIAVYRVCLTTIYACGLRLTEGSRLLPSDPAVGPLSDCSLQSAFASVANRWRSLRGTRGTGRAPRGLGRCTSPFPARTSIHSESRAWVPQNLNLLNRRMRTRMSGGVGGT